MSTSIKERINIHQRLALLGLNHDQVETLRRIASTLSRWHELECGTENAAGASISIERNETTGKPVRRIAYADQGGYKEFFSPAADLEAGAIKRLAKLMAGFPELTYCIQTDPRGHALYILKRSDVNGHDIEQVYNRGVAVY